jgi:outer membrane receptor protein involved in Fe transport
VCRQRRNLGALRARGLEADATVVVGAHGRVSAGVLWSDSSIVAGPPALAGRRTAQVPRVLASAGAAWEPHTGPRAAVDLRYVGQQFEDDLNTLSLGGFAVADVVLGWRLDERWEVFFHIENAFDRTYPVGRTGDGLVTVGTPLLAHGGVRARF